MSNETLSILIISGISIIITAVAVVLFYTLKKTRYDDQKGRILLEEIRASFEKQLYTITDRLMKNEDRWRDVNHLFLRKELESKEITKYDTNKRVRLNNFLKSNGINEEDLKIDENLVFVLTPFHEMFNQDYNIIKGVCDNVGLKCQR